MSAAPVRVGAVRVLLADREGSARRAVAELLRELDGVVLAGEVGAREDIPSALRHTAADALVIDDRLLTGLGPLRAGLLVLVLGVDDDPAYAARARRLGAHSWIAKDRAGEQLPALLLPS
jgi:DNA-binding NarL/FixJ family response regulator